VTRQIDITMLSAKERQMYDDKRAVAQKRRDENYAAGLCINENAKGTHGAATHGVRCQACYDVHRRTNDLAAWKNREISPPRIGRRLVLLPILYAEVA
jgi:hypothetical protein